MMRVAVVMGMPCLRAVFSTRRIDLRWMIQFRKIIGLAHR